MGDDESSGADRESGYRRNRIPAASGTWTPGSVTACTSRSRFSAGEYDQAPFRFRLEPASGGVLRLALRPRSGRQLQRHDLEVGVDRPGRGSRHGNEYLQTSPESGFVKVMTVQHHDVDQCRWAPGSGALTRRGERVHHNACESRRAQPPRSVTFSGSTFDTLAEEDAQQSLWVKLHEAHERWLSAAAAEDE